MDNAAKKKKEKEREELLERARFLLQINQNGLLWAVLQWFSPRRSKKAGIENPPTF